MNRSIPYVIYSYLRRCVSCGPGKMSTKRRRKIFGKYKADKGYCSKG